MRRIVTAVLIAGTIGLVLASPQLFPGTKIVAQAEPVINKVMDLATIGAVLFIISLPIQVLLRGKRK